MGVRLVTDMELLDGCVIKLEECLNNKEYEVARNVILESWGILKERFKSSQQGIASGLLDALVINIRNLKQHGGEWRVLTIYSLLKTFQDQLKVGLPAEHFEVPYEVEVSTSEGLVVTAFEITTIGSAFNPRGWNMTAAGQKTIYSVDDIVYIRQFQPIGVVDGHLNPTLKEKVPVATFVNHVDGNFYVDMTVEDFQKKLDSLGDSESKTSLKSSKIF